MGIEVNLRFLKSIRHHAVLIPNSLRTIIFVIPSLPPNFFMYVLV